ncbi:Dipeptidyl aminopeptidase-like protein 6 [Echinococcus granulosus]|nr:Dipeptidyl aminopeptidase-like protein 6 [Echinococcus granulosus]
MTERREEKQTEATGEGLEVSPSLMGNGGAEFGEVDDVDVKPSSQVAKRNWKGLLLALLVITVISALIVLACFLTYDYKIEPNYGLPLTLNDIVMLNGLINRPNAQFTNDNLVYLSSNGSLLAIDLKTYKHRLLMTSAQLREKQNFTGILSVSENMATLLLRYLFIPIYRRSYFSQYQAVLLSPGNNPQIKARVDIGPFEEGFEQPLLNHAQFSPNSEALAFVYKNHIYCQRNPFNKSVDNMPVPITAEIYREGVLYGVAGFVYEEEILGVSQTFWWSPQGTKLAFTAIDETNVTKTKLLFFETPGTFGPYVNDHSYPMAGEERKYNMPFLTLYVYLMATKKLIEFERPRKVPQDALMTFFKWIDDERFLCGWVSRKWDFAWIVVGDVPSKTMYSIYQEHARFGWVNLPNQHYQMPIVELAKQSILTVIPNYYSANVYRGIARLSLNISRHMTTQYPQWVHTPDYDVRDILYSFGGKEILYTSIGKDPKEMHLFITRGGTQAKCLTCGDPNCHFNSAKVSKDGTNIILECLGPSPPSIYLKRLVRNATNIGSLEHVAVVVNNTKLKEMVAVKAMPVTRFENVTIHKGTTAEITLNVKFVQPPELVETHITQYPVLLETYGGPISQTVTTKFVADWQSYLVTQFKFVVISIDGRGTGNRGKRFESAIYKKLGVVEVRDQIDGLRQILKTHKYLNRSKICAFGWSYGGFAVANILGHPDNDFILCGVAVAPVTDFRLYDAAYTEKYLGPYSENSHAYERTHVTQLARNFKNKDFLIIHGMADDNVNLIHSALLIKELIRQGVGFDMMFYPDDNHFIAQRHFRPHLWRKVITFIVDSVNRTSIRHRHNGEEARHSHHPLDWLSVWFFQRNNCAYVYFILWTRYHLS